MRKLFVIGIGAGNPDYVTVQAINALNEVDVFFVMEKGQEKEDLVRLRKEICERYVKDRPTGPLRPSIHPGTETRHPTSRPCARGTNKGRGYMSD
jgi:precorrin-2 methylase